MVSRVGEWAFIGTTTAPPANGQLRLNTTIQTAATKVWVHKTTATSVDASTYLLQITAGQELYFQDKDNFTKWQVYKITAPPINQPTYVEYPAVWVRGGGIDVPAQRIFLAFDEISTQEVLSSPFAYPSVTAFGISMGLTKREYFAAQLAIGFVSSGVASNLTGGQLAEWAFKAADSMIVQASKESGEGLPPAGTPKGRAPGR